MPDIHKAAIISAEAELAEDVEIGPYTVISGNAKIGSGTKVGAHCIIDTNTEIGSGCEIFSGAVIGSVTQDKKAEGDETFLRIGDNNTIREYVTINRATGKGNSTVIGNNNLIMAYSHIAHDCCIGNEVVMANCVTLAGHVTIEDQAIMGGLAGIHQFMRIGRLAIIGGCSKVVQDIVPYSMSDGHPAKIYGVNSIGLERAGISNGVKSHLKKAFKILFSKKLNLANAVKRVKQEIPQTEEIRHLVDFINSSERGISR